MLKWLHIKNLALVNEADLELGPGFNAITGETGAGKSVLMGGVALLLGGRFDKSAIRQGTDRCEISGEFLLEDDSRHEVAALLEENGIEPCDEDQLLIRRVFTHSGGRIFINSSPATAQILRAIGEQLVDIHSADEAHGLMRLSAQLKALDRFAHLDSLLNRCAAAFEGLDLSEGVDLDDLAGLLQVKKRKLRKQLRELINKGWLTGWLDERGNCLYLSAADYRAAHNIPPQPAPEPKAQPQPEPEAGAAPDKTVLHLETAQRFAHVLAEERKLMADPAAADELGKMQKTTESICAWLESHPESAPKARRFAEYYIPTTLKLLHTYNDVQGQQGDNAEAIRRDIGGILHTLNTAYANLYDTLLGDAALDVSSEIAALEGMLASDGLTGEGFSTGEGAR